MVTTIYKFMHTHAVFLYVDAHTRMCIHTQEYDCVCFQIQNRNTLLVIKLSN